MAGRGDGVPLSISLVPVSTFSFGWLLRDKPSMRLTRLFDILWVMGYALSFRVPGCEGGHCAFGALASLCEGGS